MAKEQVAQKYLVVDTETTGVNPHKCKLLGISTSDGNEVSYECPQLDDKDIFYKNFRFNDQKLVGHNIKYDQIVLRKHGVKLAPAYFDTLLAYYLLHIDKPKKLETVVKEVFKYDKQDLVQTYNKSTGQKRVNLPEDWYEHINKDLLAQYAMEDAEYTYKLFNHLSEELKAQPILEKWFHEVEMVVCNILTEMELKGVKVNRLKLESLRDELSIKSKDLEKRIIYYTGQKDFNLNSPKQLQELLYKKFKLPVLATTESGQPSTDKDTLVQLEKQTGHIFLNMFLKYREYQKVLTTYTDSMLNDLDNKDRIHTTYNQALTNTRRFSSNSPNLQNIPTRSDIGKQVKSCFVPEAGHVFLIADYSQLEPRILAHLSGDKFLIDCFKNGKDIYEDTASIVRQAGFEQFGRDRAKTLFLALMYGKSSYGLSSDWHCSQQEAQEIIDSVFKKLSGVSNYINETHERAFKNGGWLTTLAGLPLYVGNPYTNNKWESSAVDRCAVNYPIQGSSQDILKKAMVNIYNKYDVIPVLMVHDELVFELGRSHLLNNGLVIHSKQLEALLIAEMEHAWELKVPLKVESKISDHWEK